MPKCDRPSQRPDRPKVVMTDYDFGDVNVERDILKAVGAEVITFDPFLPAKAASEDGAEHWKIS